MLINSFFDFKFFFALLYVTFPNTLTESYYCSLLFNLIFFQSPNFFLFLLVFRCTLQRSNNFFLPFVIDLKNVKEQQRKFKVHKVSNFLEQKFLPTFHTMHDHFRSWIVILCSKYLTTGTYVLSDSTRPT
jgi:hypothetical protein